MGRWRLWGCSRLLSDIDPGAHDVIRRHGQDQLSIVGQFSGPGGLGTLSLQQPLLADHFVLTLPFHQALTGPPVHSLLFKLLSDLEVDLCGTHGGGGFDVESVPLLFDLHILPGFECEVWSGGRSGVPATVRDWASLLRSRVPTRLNGNGAQ